MLREELYKEILMDYEELADYLIEKYGPAKYDYFCNESCKTKNKKVTRTDEGLQCHHIDEDKYGNLSSPTLARMRPFSCQKKDRLVYCNLIEHCLLHYKICFLTQAYEKVRPIDVEDFFDSAGTFHTAAIINDLYVKNGSPISYQQNYYEAIKDNYDDYIWMITIIAKSIDENYLGKRTPEIINLNNSIVAKGEKGVITGYTLYKDTIDVQFVDGKKETVSLYDISNVSHLDYLDIKLRSFSTGAKGVFYDTIYNDILSRMSVSTKEDAYVLAVLKEKAAQLAKRMLVFAEGSKKPLDISYNDNKKFEVGERLLDKKFGLGTITDASFFMGDINLTIDFDTYGELHMTRTYFQRRNMLCDNPKQFSNSPQLPDFQIGDRVIHKAFGKGKVVDIKPLGADQVITIEFKKVGTKDLLKSFSRLEKA